MITTTDDTRTESNTQVSTRIAASWGLGSLGTATMLNGVSAILLYFLVTFVKLEPVLAGALLFGSKMKIPAKRWRKWRTDFSCRNQIMWRQ